MASVCHQFTSATLESSVQCAVCDVILDDDSALKCENCGVYVHESCKDQIEICPGEKNHNNEKGSPEKARTPETLDARYYQELAFGSRDHRTFDIDESAAPAPRSSSSSGLSCSMDSGVLKIVAIIVAIIVGLLVILLPISFSSLDYYEYGFIRRKSTGVVDTDRVYTVGRYLVGPDSEFKIFPANAQFEAFNSITVFASDRLQVSISGNMQYFLRADQLARLHKKYDIHYKPILRNNAIDAIKGAATAFSTRDFFRRREIVEAALFKAVKERLGGKCCEKDCAKNGNCATGCKVYTSCSASDMGLFTEVRYLQLTRLDIPDELNQRYLQALVLQEASATEKLKQESQVIRKETTQLVKQYENRALEIRQNATAQSDLISSRAQAHAKAALENARSDGLKQLYNNLGISAASERASFDYLRTLRASDHIQLAVDYNTLVAGPMNKG